MRLFSEFFNQRQHIGLTGRNVIQKSSSESSYQSESTTGWKVEAMCCHLFKIVLSLFLAASLMIPNSWCCQSDSASDLVAAIPHTEVHPPHTEQEPQPTTDDSHPHCGNKLFASSGKSRLTGNTSPYLPVEKSFTAAGSCQESIAAGRKTSAAPRPLHLMNCVWRC